jgi:hypothetical protein
MNEKLSREQRTRKLLLLANLICYEAFFVFSIINLHYPGFNYPWYLNQRNFIVLLFWTGLLLLHVGATYYQRGRGSISQIERDAYRDGFADAMRQLGSQADAVERLSLDDEGELVELPMQPPAKRKRQP